MKVKKFMVGFEMLAQVQRDLTAEKVGSMECMLYVLLYVLSRGFLLHQSPRAECNKSECLPSN